jgi:hypothetical protein
VTVDDLAPFTLDEVPTVEGRYRLTLHREYFAATTATFSRWGDESDSIGWAWVARYLLRTYAEGHLGSVEITHRPDAMTLYGPRGALSWLGTLLHDAFHRPERLATVIEEAQDRDLSESDFPMLYCGPDSDRPQAFNDLPMYFWSHRERSARPPSPSSSPRPR